VSVLCAAGGWRPVPWPADWRAGGCSSGAAGRAQPCPVCRRAAARDDGRWFGLLAACCGSIRRFSSLLIRACPPPFCRPDARRAAMTAARPLGLAWPPLRFAWLVSPHRGGCVVAAAAAQRLSAAVPSFHNCHSRDWFAAGGGLLFHRKLGAGADPAWLLQKLSSVRLPMLLAATVQLLHGALMPAAVGPARLAACCWPCPLCLFGGAGMIAGVWWEVMDRWEQPAARIRLPRSGGGPEGPEQAAAAMAGDGDPWAHQVVRGSDRKSAKLRRSPTPGSRRGMRGWAHGGSSDRGRVITRAGWEPMAIARQMPRWMQRQGPDREPRTGCAPKKSGEQGKGGERGVAEG